VDGTGVELGTGVEPAIGVELVAFAVLVENVSFIPFQIFDKKFIGFVFE
jgi:hypothetical protein